MREWPAGGPDPRGGAAHTLSHHTYRGATVDTVAGALKGAYEAALQVAERAADDTYGGTGPDRTDRLARAQVRATLAVAAAVAWLAGEVLDYPDPGGHDVDQ